MSFKRMVLVSVVLVTAVTVMFLAGCSLTATQQQSALAQSSSQGDDVFMTKGAVNPGTGSDGGYFWTYWKSDGATGTIKAAMDGGKGFSIGVTNFCGGTVIGKGWQTGSSSRVVTITNKVWSNSYGGAFGLYGWTKNPLVEYYVIEHEGAKENPVNSPDIDGQKHTYVGFMGSDNAAYGAWKNYRVNKPSIIGTASFWQYMDITEGFYESAGRTITFKNHVNYWANAGLNLGTHDYQIVFAEFWSKQTNGTNIPGQTVTGAAVGGIY